MICMDMDTCNEFTFTIIYIKRDHHCDVYTLIKPITDLEYKIFNDIESADIDYVIPSVKKNFIRMTLQWDITGPIDMHIFEPTIHQFFRNSTTFKLLTIIKQNFI
jgi:hypothetical protein